MTNSAKPTITFTIFCDDVRQEIGGKISLMGIFENIYATSFPAIHPRLAIVTEWTEGKGEYDTNLRILSPDRKTVLRETSSRMRLSETGVRHRDVSIHLNIEFDRPGVYWVEHLLDGEVIHSMPMRVFHVKEQKLH